MIPHLEELVESMYRRAGADDNEAWRPTRLARHFLGADALVVVPGLVELGSVRTFQGRHVIGVQEGLPRPIVEWVVGHELAHVWGVTDEDEADYVGAAIQMRRAAFERAQNDHRDVWTEHAKRFCVTSTSAVLRAGELERRSLAVVAPRKVYMRGGWPDATTVRAWAKTGAPGIKAAKLPDAPRRTVLERA